MLINLASWAISLVLGALALRLYQGLRRRCNALSYALPFRFEKAPIYICYGLVEPQGDTSYFTVEEGDLAAIYSLATLLGQNYGHDRIKIVNHVATEAMLNEIVNLVCVSGPLWNRVTELNIGALGSPVIFDSKSEKLVWRKNDTDIVEFETTYSHSNKPKICFGVILVGQVETPDGGKQKILLCAGNSNLSTYGLTVFLHRLYHKRDLIKILKGFRIRSAQRWGLIIRTEDRSAIDLERLRFSPLNMRYLDVNIEAYIPEEDFIESYEYHY